MSGPPFHNKDYRASAVVDFHVSCHFMDTYVVWLCFASGARAPSPLTLCLPAGNWAAL